MSQPPQKEFDYVLGFEPDEGAVVVFDPTPGDRWVLGKLSSDEYFEDVVRQASDRAGAESKDLVER